MRWAATLILAMSAAMPAKAEDALKSATSYLSEDLKKRQADETVNPGMLWVSEGEELWKKADGAAAKSCAACHGDASSSMKGVATHYPAIDPATGKLLNLELRIGECRTKHQGAAAFPYESEELLALTSYVARQSFGMPIEVSVQGAAGPYFKKGRALFYLRQGQINLSCANCHEEKAGHRLRGDVISSGIPSGYPAYRLEWQSLGSLHRRLRACALGVRAILFPYGSEELVSLELYLSKRAEGFPLEPPAIRK